MLRFLPHNEFLRIFSNLHNLLRYKLVTGSSFLFLLPKMQMTKYASLSSGTLARTFQIYRLFIYMYFTSVSETHLGKFCPNNYLA